MQPVHYFAKVEGYNNKRRKDAELLRQSVFANKAGWEGALSYGQFCSRFFPLWFDNINEAQPLEMSKEMMADILNRHKRFHSKKNGRS